MMRENWQAYNVSECNIHPRLGIQMTAMFSANGLLLVHLLVKSYTNSAY